MAVPNLLLYPWLDAVNKRLAGDFSTKPAKAIIISLVTGVGLFMRLYLQWRGEKDIMHVCSIFLTVTSFVLCFKWFWIFWVHLWCIYGTVYLIKGCFMLLDYIGLLVCLSALLILKACKYDRFTSLPNTNFGK